MIASINCKETRKVWEGKFTKKWDEPTRRKAQMKLDILDAVMNIEELKIPPSNRLHQLHGDLKEYHSISINMKWRIIFKWENNNAHQIQIVDYH